MNYIASCIFYFYEFIPYVLLDNLVIPKDDRKISIKILRRFEFLSELRRMSVIAQITQENRSIYLATVKGAPEILQTMFSSYPTNYETTYKKFAREGYRILALGYKYIKKNDIGNVSTISRDTVENDLLFGGFLVFHCPLKSDSKDALLNLKCSSHLVSLYINDIHP
jgi:cation-transporting ATPase 13A1